MEIIHGRSGSQIDRAAIVGRLPHTGGVSIDLGTGDGRYVVQQARANPASLVIGVDACREQLIDQSRRAPANALFVIANALALPPELDGLAASITINFPWASLLRGLLDADAGLLDGLRRIVQPGATLDLRLNAGALIEAGSSLAEGNMLVRHALRQAGFAVRSSTAMDSRALRVCPTSWARRLAWGRDPHALHLHAVQIADRLIDAGIRA